MDLVQIHNSDYVEYVIDVPESSQYTFAVRFQSPVYSGQINVQSPSSLWMSLPHTNGAYQTTFANVWMDAGARQRLRVAFPQGGFKICGFGIGSGTNNPPQLDC